MKKKYIPATDGREVIPVYSVAHQAPPFTHQPLINRPNQAMPSIQPARQNYTTGPNSGWLRALAGRLASRATVDVVPVQQPGFKLVAALRVYREGWRSPIVPEPYRMPKPNQSAPPRLQSIPGYIVTSVQTTDANINLASMYVNLRAPSLTEGSGSCG